MEYMRIEGFLGKAISKLIDKAIYNWIGYKPKINILNLNLTTDPEENMVEVKLTAKMTRADFEKLMEEVTN